MSRRILDGSEAASSTILLPASYPGLPRQRCREPHLSQHPRSRGEIVLRLDPVTELITHPAEADAAVRDERAHLPRCRERHRFGVVPCGLLERAVARVYVAEQPQRPRFVSMLVLGASELERLAGRGHRFVGVAGR